MAVDANTVRRIAHLARIAVAEDEVDHLKGELNAMLSFVEQLAEVNVGGVEPMTSVTPMEMKKRADVVTDGGIPDDIVRNAPAVEDLRTSLISYPANGRLPALVKGVRRVPTFDDIIAALGNPQAAPQALTVDQVRYMLAHIRCPTLAYGPLQSADAGHSGPADLTCYC